MATETDAEGGLDKRESHLRSITVTAVATLAGIVAGVVSAAITTSPTDQLGIVAYVVLALAQFPLLRLLGVDVSGFSVKDNLYVLFMTFSLWFVTWAVLINGAT